VRDLRELRTCAGLACRQRAHLKLALRYRRGRLDSKGSSCAQLPVSARIKGGDAFTVRRATFYIRGKRVQTTARPFEIELPPDAISDRRTNRVHATAALADGRELTFEADFERAC
jgi:hypothetical protein